MRTGKTHRLKTCATGESSEGLPVPREPALLTSAARMAKRGQHRASEGPEPVASVRRWARGAPSSRDGQTQVNNLCYGGAPSLTCDPYQAAFEVGRVAARPGPIVRRTTHVGRPWASR